MADGDLTSEQVRDLTAKMNAASKPKPSPLSANLLGSSVGSTSTLKARPSVSRGSKLPNLLLPSKLAPPLAFPSAGPSKPSGISQLMAVKDPLLSPPPLNRERRRSVSIGRERVKNPLERLHPENPHSPLHQGSAVNICRTFGVLLETTCYKVLRDIITLVQHLMKQQGGAGIRSSRPGQSDPQGHGGQDAGTSFVMSLFVVSLIDTENEQTHCDEMADFYEKLHKATRRISRTIKDEGTREGELFSRQYLKTVPNSFRAFAQSAKRLLNWFDEVAPQLDQAINDFRQRLPIYHKSPRKLGDLDNQANELQMIRKSYYSLIQAYLQAGKTWEALVTTPFPTPYSPRPLPKEMRNMSELDIVFGIHEKDGSEFLLDPAPTPKHLLVGKYDPAPWIAAWDRIDNVSLRLTIICRHFGKALMDDAETAKILEYDEASHALKKTVWKNRAAELEDNEYAGLKIRMLPALQIALSDHDRPLIKPQPLFPPRLGLDPDLLTSQRGRALVRAANLTPRAKPAIDPMLLKELGINPGPSTSPATRAGDLLSSAGTDPLLSLGAIGGSLPPLGPSAISSLPPLGVLGRRPASPIGARRGRTPSPGPALRRSGSNVSFPRRNASVDLLPGGGSAGSSSGLDFLGVAPNKLVGGDILLNTGLDDHRLSAELLLGGDLLSGGSGLGQPAPSKSGSSSKGKAKAAPESIWGDVGRYW